MVLVENGTGTGFSFEGSSDMRQYVVTIDNEKLDVKGTITFQSVRGPNTVYTSQHDRI